ncbi:hypothetical protein Unana1_02903 [Umbelopsis nana]
MFISRRVDTLIRARCQSTYITFDIASDEQKRKMNANQCLVKKRKTKDTPQDKVQKRAGNQLLKASNANPNLPPMKCPSCQGTDHRNSKSKLCPNHSLKIDKEVKARLGNSTEQYCCKIPFESIVRPAMLERLRTNVVTLCFHVREISVRTQVFVNWYILKRIHEGQDVPNYIYNRNCFYSICQLVLGRDITSANTNMPPDIVSDWRQFSTSWK